MHIHEPPTQKMTQAMNISEDDRMPLIPVEKKIANKNHIKMSHH